MRQARKSFFPLVLFLVGAAPARSADFREEPYPSGPPHAERCCAEEALPYWEMDRPSGPHGGFLPVYRGGCWHWWYNQWSRVC